MISSKQRTRVSSSLLLLVTATVFCSLLCTSALTASMRVSITSAERMEDAPEWVATPPTADHAALLARALGDASNYLATVQRPICLHSVFALKVQHADAHRTNYLFQVNGCVVETSTRGGFCRRDTSCRPMPFEVEVHAERAFSSSLGQADTKLVIVAIRYLD